MHMKSEYEKRISALLIQWCDALLRLQIDMPEYGQLDGGILCPACGTVHGRCHEAVYPLMCAAEITGEEKYLNAAKRLFRWGQNMLNSDGSVRNDFKSGWKGVTVFAAISLSDALDSYGGMLSSEERNEWEERLSGMGVWLYENLTEKHTAYLNYHAANACAMSLLGTRYNNDDYLKQAKKSADFCMDHITENSLVYGEGSPDSAVTAKGCRAVDIGYNAEETLPCLYRYGVTVGDHMFTERVAGLWRSQIEWMLPDGAWDNSVGTRSFKWTYWGSRTADGCQAALFDLGRKDPVFSEAAWRNFELYERCTHDGLLAGGPDYIANGEPLCVHHTFCHAKTLAFALNQGVPDFERTELFSDKPERVKYYPELNTYRAAAGGWRMDVTGYDSIYSGTKHVSGGAVSMLWNREAGAVIAAGPLDGPMKEPNNQQFSVHPETCRCSCPRIEIFSGGKLYGQHYCRTAVLSEREADEILITADSFICDENGEEMPGDSACSLAYLLSGEGLRITGRVAVSVAEAAQYVLPVAGDKAEVEILTGKPACEPVKMFSISPGFAGTEYRIVPDSGGMFSVIIKLKR